LCTTVEMKDYIVAAHEVRAWTWVANPLEVEFSSLWTVSYFVRTGPGTAI
jgi:hypothetical protein